ncbi:hypothetical protein [Mycolicibacter kumamotonensis]|uniref:Uncharacterized protein n=1 Tax=Mycolicibacter kumamotonensis TaxID=354243 RepID=A0A1B8SLF6_9MYCO|nr:hypothetical protein [Mycolicibacter kumamotonensis]OBY33534.1 hypothetical protein ACT18_00970 [Mycolicibacter kumamotonensis]
MSGAYLIWGCCAYCEEEDSLDEALGFARAMSNGDGHIFHGIECPDGRLIDSESKEFHDYCKRRDREEEERRERWEREHPTSERVGILCIRSPFSKGWDRETYTDQQRLDFDQAVAVTRFGADRVRVLTGADMDDWRALR